MSQQAGSPEATPTSEDGNLFAAISAFNVAGLAMFGASFLPAMWLTTILKDEREGLTLVLAGPLAVGIDLWYRLRYRPLSADLFWPGRGGKFVFLPVWLLGMFWFVCGLCQLRN